ncbi:MAG: metallophosphoesterase [Candidatus Korarchaeum sp.]|nr:metallophosphoesterase [Candidatus Korarchaeum sp.]MDW8035879.1 metallophosphoesterase [Candidatus Korarchaeum sp.]
MRILGLSDVHAPVFLKELKEASDRCGDADLLLLAGDIVDRGRIEYYGEVLDILSSTGAKIVAVFGNDEFDDLKDELRKNLANVLFLDDESIVLRIDETTIGIVGSRGSLELPTVWQRRKIPNIERLYEDRVRFIGEMLRKLRNKVYITILLTHYATTTKTLRGENPRAWRYLGHRGFEKYLQNGLVDIAVHGHSHNGTRFATIGRGAIYNVAFPLWRRVVDISPKEKVTVEEYFER